MRHCGIDVHSTTSDLCELSSTGKVLRRERFPSTQSGFRKHFEGVAKRRVVMESGGSTPWVYRLLCELGHEVVVVNPRRLRLIAESTLKDAREKVIGDLTVTAPVAFGSTWLAPRLGSFADTYPETRLKIMLDDREYDLLKLEAECAIRLWAATHADLIQRKLLEVRVSLYASASYLQRHGTPKKVEDLDQHRSIT